MKDEHFFVVQGWMINRLHLSGTELMVYAIINGFCQHGDGDGYIGGNATLMKWTGASARTISLTLQSLEEKGLITRSYIKTQKGRLGKIWTHGAEFAPPSEEKEGDSAESALPIVQNLQDGSCKNCTTHDAKSAHITYTDTYISPNGENKKAQAPREDPAAELDPAVREAFRDYEQMRAKIKAAMTDKAKAMAIDKLKKLASDPAKQVAILNQSTMNSWKGLYELKEEKAQTQTQTQRGTFFNFEQRPIDPVEYAELEKKLLRKGRHRDDRREEADGVAPGAESVLEGEQNGRPEKLLGKA